ncbi:MAG TPA: cytochrome P460 family protein [Hyphomicrobiaceae bacterium]|nr:cytochrome P460 family protein [Hyphomicrobiaceae bacterium]
MMKKFALACTTLFAVAAVTVGVRAGPDNVKFPVNYAKGVLYTPVDRPDNKQYRELFITPYALDEVKAGRALPSGTVLTMVNYKAKLDEAGNPVKDGNGRFIKTDEIAGIAVMEKRAGWGAEYPADMRNGEWEYRAFKADGSVNDKADLKPCFTCHLQKVSNQDFVFSLDKIKAAAAK